MDFLQLKGKKVIITGASRGIGLATAKLFIEAGAKVLFSATNQEKLDNIIQDYNEDQACALACDLSKLDEIENFVGKAIELLGDVDIFVCNAGITRDALAMRMSFEKWQEVIDVNLHAPFLLNQKIAKYMAKKRKGNIVNVTSLVGAIGNIGQVNYSAAKAGVIAMTKTLAKEFVTRNIRFNSIAPGFIETDMTNAINQNIINTVLEEIPMKRFGNPQEIANAILFLASDMSSYMTGQTLHVNGGLWM